MTDSQSNLSPCGCCTKRTFSTPVKIVNYPGLTSLIYRVGTHGRFKASMLAAMAGQASLAGLRIRDDDDPSIALLDSWSAVLDVLSFYQERIANEGYIRTATERRSLLELARTIGYELKPGVAASAFLAFMMETAKGSPERVTIDVGTKVQSIPGQDEKPQIFETIAKIEARSEWNQLRPRQTAPQSLEHGSDHIYLLGMSTNLKVGDALLLVGVERKEDIRREEWEFRRVAEITPDPDNNRTYVRFNAPLGHERPWVNAPKRVHVYALRTRASLFGFNAPKWHALPVSLRIGDISPDPKDRNRFIDGLYAGRSDSWAEAEFEAGRARINLDSVYSSVVKDSWIVLEKPSYVELFYVTSATEENKVDYGLSAKTTRLEISGENIHFFSPRITTVYAQSELLELADAPLSDRIARNYIQLEKVISGLRKGQWLSFTEENKTTGEQVSEIVSLFETTDSQGHTTLCLDKDLTHDFSRTAVVINANVAPATHGETTRQEVLGAGDAARSFQKFVLKQSPLTHVAAATASGAASTLAVRANNLVWDETDALYQSKPNQHVFTTRRSDDGKTTVEFGDGINGSRLPTGVENITATYRVGLGKAGNVKAGQLSLLMTRPLGVKSVVNPLNATGGNDPETRDEARQNAPLTVLTLDRVVSLQDYEDFARSFAGIAKAQAVLLWNGDSRFVHITIAGPDGASIPTSSDTYIHLRQALDSARHALQTVKVDSFTSLSFNLEASVYVQREYLPESVCANVTAELNTYFSFNARGFGQSVTVSQVEAAMQRVAGVKAIDLDFLYRSTGPSSLKPRLTSDIAHAEQGTISPAQLLTINPNGIKLKAILL